MATIENTIASLEAKLKQAKAKKQKLEARKRTLESKKERAQETRKKILIGSAILNEISKGNWSNIELLKIMENFLTRDEDRKIFELCSQHKSKIN